MELDEYQRSALQTNLININGPDGTIAPMLGLASETGSILNVYKKYLRDGIDLEKSKEFLKEELGDLLWYLAVVAQSCNLSLNDIATDNLERTANRHGEVDLRALGSFEAQECPVEQRFPRKSVFRFEQQEQKAESSPRASVTLIDAQPNAFPDGCIEIDGKITGYTVGAPLGAQLTDNVRVSDGYRYHDALHMAFMAVLGWSPVMRDLLRIKRKYDPDTDRDEDGARAGFMEEGLAATLASLSRRRMGFLKEQTIGGDVLDIVVALVAAFEVSRLPLNLWRRAISNGFAVMDKLQANKGGYVIADLESRSLQYEKTYQPPSRSK